MLQPAMLQPPQAMLRHSPAQRLHWPLLHPQAQPLTEE